MTRASGNSHDKVKRYGWANPDQQGKFMMVPKELLNVDRDRYQRETGHSGLMKARRIAGQLCWAAFGVLIVARRADGSMWVMEGQHRKLGADLRPDVTDLPCLVFDIHDIAEEARTFLVANNERKTMSTVQKFKGAITAGDPVAIKTKALMDQAGRVPGSHGPHHIKCLGILQYHVEVHPVVLHKVWPLIISLCEGASISERIIDAIVYLELHSAPGQSVCDQKWRSRLLRVGAAEAERAMMNAASFYSKGGAKVWAVGLLNAINKGLQEKNQFRLQGEGPSGEAAE